MINRVYECIVVLTKDALLHIVILCFEVSWIYLIDGLNCVLILLIIFIRWFKTHFERCTFVIHNSKMVNLKLKQGLLYNIEFGKLQQ